MSQLQYLSHSCFMLQMGGKSLLIDPFLTGNPKAQVKPESLSPDYVLLTHGHNDHLGDAIDIAKRSKATVIAPFELAEWCGANGTKAHPMHIGGARDFDFGRVKMTIAHHSSSYTGSNGVIFTGNPVGILIMADGKTVYHAGDTGLFYDMKLIGELHPIDLAMLPIGDNFTMGIADAIKAVEFLRPKTVIPMHYNTFDVIEVDPNEFAAGVESHGVKPVIMNVGDTYEF